MRFRLLIPLITAIFAFGCGTTPTTDNPTSALHDAGVSKELATLRKATIGALSYELHFDIPEQRGEAIAAEEHVRFTLEGPQELILDFREGEKSIDHLTVNGREAAWEYLNEHIIIPAEATTTGENDVYISFIAGNQSLNRNDDYLYTLLVPDRARTLFPCFDQPDLKAAFRLSLTIPEAWTAVSNTSQAEEHIVDGRRYIAYNTTEPLSTYLFSFVAGRFLRAEHNDGVRTIVAYHRETDPARIAQLDTIFAQITSSIAWLEEYTGIAYPFAKYDIVILPGFQYGGMEHTGATLYNDTRIFVGKVPTPDEELARAALIAHETAHMWFGDYVTMAWFDDVWTKEVFANYFAARMTEPLFKDINHQLNWLKTIVASALSEDRTAGCTAIKQPLDNLSNAGLIYGRTIYNKAPVMLLKLVDIMGEDAFREGIREYLTTYAYGNADWDALIAILDRRCDADLASFSEAWVHRAGMPHIRLSHDDDRLHVEQHDPAGRNLLWPQRFEVMAVGDRMTTIEVDMHEQCFECPLPEGTRYVVPNTDGRGYGHFIMDDASREWALQSWQSLDDDTARHALLMVLYENYQHRIIDERRWAEMLLRSIPEEHNPLTLSSLCGYLASPMMALADADIEREVHRLSQIHPSAVCRLQLLRTLIGVASSDDICERLYACWVSQENDTLTEFDYMRLAYELALRYPERYDAIVEEQRSRLSNEDRLRQFDYIVRAVNPDTEARDSLFEELLTPENRRVEPWAEAALAYLTHPLHGTTSHYIRRGLDELREVQLTGDIFFPAGWASSLLHACRSQEALDAVDSFLADNPDYQPLLRNKILQAAWPLHRAHGRIATVEQ